MPLSPVQAGALGEGAAVHAADELEVELDVVDTEDVETEDVEMEDDETEDDDVETAAGAASPLRDATATLDEDA